MLDVTIDGTCCCRLDRRLGMKLSMFTVNRQRNLGNFNNPMIRSTQVELIEVWIATQTHC
jgi:hypothetical protein